MHLIWTMWHDDLFCVSWFPLGTLWKESEAWTAHKLGIEEKRPLKWKQGKPRWQSCLFVSSKWCCISVFGSSSGLGWFQCGWSSAWLFSLTTLDPIPCKPQRTEMKTEECNLVGVVTQHDSDSYMHQQEEGKHGNHKRKSQKQVPLGLF